MISLKKRRLYRVRRRETIRDVNKLIHNLALWSGGTTRRVQHFVRGPNAKTNVSLFSIEPHSRSFGTMFLMLGRINKNMKPRAERDVEHNDNGKMCFVKYRWSVPAKRPFLGDQWSLTGEINRELGGNDVDFVLVWSVYNV